MANYAPEWWRSTGTCEGPLLRGDVWMKAVRAEGHTV